MGKNQLEVASPLACYKGRMKKKKEVGVIKTTVNLFVRGDFYCTFRIKLRASAISGCRTNPPELDLAGKSWAESVAMPENIPGNGHCAQMTCETPSAIPDRVLGSFPSSSGVLSPMAELVSPQISDGRRAFYTAALKQLLSTYPTTHLHLLLPP